MLDFQHSDFEGNAFLKSLYTQPCRIKNLLRKNIVSETLLKLLRHVRLTFLREDENNIRDFTNIVTIPDKGVTENTWRCSFQAMCPVTGADCSLLIT